MRESSTPHSSDHGLPRTAAVLLPGARPSLFPVRSLPAPTTTAWLPAGCRAPALTAPTTWLAVGLTVPAPPPPRAPGSRQRARAGSSPSPRTPRAAPDHTRGSSPASEDVAPLPLARSAATSSGQGGKPRPRTPVPLHHPGPQRSPRWLKVGTHRRRPRVAGRAVVPRRLRAGGSRRWYCVRSAVALAHLVRRWSRLSSEVSAGPGVPVVGAV